LRALHWGRPDLFAAFPDLHEGPDAYLYLRWAEREAPQQWIPRQLAMPEALRRGENPDDLGGVNVVGYLKAESGVGEGARLLMDALDAGDVPFAQVDWSRTRVRQEAPLASRAGAPSYDINIVCVNADQLPVYIDDGGKELVDAHFTIGMWAWEV